MNDRDRQPTEKEMNIEEKACDISDKENEAFKSRPGLSKDGYIETVTFEKITSVRAINNKEESEIDMSKIACGEIVLCFGEFLIQHDDGNLKINIKALWREGDEIRVKEFFFKTYNRISILDSGEEPTNKLISLSTIFLRKDKDRCIAYWSKNGEIIQKSLPFDNVQEIYEKTWQEGQKSSMDKNRVQSIVSKYECCEILPSELNLFNQLYKRLFPASSQDEYIRLKRDTEEDAKLIDELQAMCPGAEKSYPPSIFKGAKKWTVPTNPPFAIITGRNGSGKSQLLKHIHDKYFYKTSQAHNQLFHTIYINASHQFGRAGYHHNSFDDLDISHIPNKLALNKYVEEVIAFYEKGREPSSSFAISIKNQIEYGQRKEPLYEKKPITREYVFDIASMTIYYKFNELILQEPMKFLTYIVRQYEIQKTTLKNNLDNITAAYTLYEHYVGHYEQKPDPQETVEDFLKKLSRIDFMIKLKESYSNKKIGPSPLTTINSILGKYGFKYTIEIDASHQEQFLERSNRSKVNLKLRKGSKDKVAFTDLSSGEIMALTMLSWLFYTQGLSGEEENIRQIENKVKVMLLDEPDKHLDPELCRLFYKIVYEEFVMKHKIQVIMTSHRIDTVALAPPGHIFLIEKDQGITRIVNVHKLRALFHMSGNLREMFNYHHKVYTESTIDARFYEGTYHSLKELCDEIRMEEKKKEGQKGYFWRIQTDGSKLPEAQRLLSNRYQLGFYSVSMANGGQGGCPQIINTIKRENEAINNLAYKKITIDKTILSSRWKKTGKILTDPKLYKSYGIVDKDFGQDRKLDAKGVEDQIVTLTRHSIENFLFDPFIFCQVLNEEEIRSSIAMENNNLTEQRKDDFIDACKKIKNFIKEEEEKISKDQLDKQLSNYFKIIMENMYENWKKYTLRFIELKEHLPEKPGKAGKNKFYYSKDKDTIFYAENQEVFKKIENCFKEQKKEGQGHVSDNQGKDIKELILEVLLERLKNDDFLTFKGIQEALQSHPLLHDEKIYILNKRESILELLYPQKILEVKGHNIEKFFFCKNDMQSRQLREEIADKIYENGLQYIPLDLAGVFFKLNDKVRETVRAVIISPEARKIDDDMEAEKDQKGMEAHFKRFSVSPSRYRSPSENLKKRRKRLSDSDSKSHARPRHHVESSSPSVDDKSSFSSSLIGASSTAEMMLELSRSSSSFSASSTVSCFSSLPSQEAQPLSFSSSSLSSPLSLLSSSISSFSLAPAMISPTSGSNSSASLQASVSFSSDESMHRPASPKG